MEVVLFDMIDFKPFTIYGKRVCMCNSNVNVIVRHRPTYGSPLYTDPRYIADVHATAGRAG